ncbi:MAG: DEAD/DEAH box helicase [Gammaproteobacteria bacterium]
MQSEPVDLVDFTRLNLHALLEAGLKKAGFERCTPIQAKTLPRLLDGQDVAGQAQTGTGKTAAYLLATMQKLLDHPRSSDSGGHPRAIILAPTRELAIQIHSDAELLGGETGLQFGLVYGGVDYEKQRQTVSDGIDILIGTPGRIIDYFKQRVFNLRHIEVCVLDEADRMFDLGFIKDLRFLLRRMPDPTKRLSMLFSATLSHRVNELAYEHMNNPEFIEVSPDKRVADRVEQRLYHTAANEKMALLIGLFREINPSRTLVFVNTKRVAMLVVDYFNVNGFSASALSGDVAQNKRQRLIGDFSSGKVDIVVATDVAARGLHIDDVSHVVNFDLPQNPEDYVHRIGRTARAGAAGDAISFACEEYVFSLEAIEEYIGHKIPVSQVPEELLVDLVKPAKRERPKDKRRPRPRRRN